MPFFECNLGKSRTTNKFYLIQSGTLANGSTENIYNANSGYQWNVKSESGYRYLNGHGYSDNYYALTNQAIINYEYLHLICQGYFTFGMNATNNVGGFCSFLQQGTGSLNYGRSATLPSNNNGKYEVILKLDGITNNVVIVGGCRGRTQVINNQCAFLKLYDMWLT